MARRDYCCCQLNSPCFFGCFLCSQLSVARRGALQAPCSHLAIYSQTQQPCLLSSWKWNPLEQKTQCCEVSWRKVWYKCLGPSVLWAGIIHCCCSCSSADFSGNTEHLRNVVIFIILYGPTKKIFFFSFFPPVLAVQGEFAETEINQT